MKGEFSTMEEDLKMSESQVEAFAYAIYEDIDKYVDTKSDEYNQWLLYEIIVDAINEISDEKHKMKNKYD